MSKSKYLDVYNYLKENIINGTFKSGEKLPSENELTNIFSVSRNTVRRAIDMLSADGLTTSVHGKGVFVIENKSFKFLVGGLQSFKEASENNNIKFLTDIPIFETVIVDESLSKKTGFLIGTKILHLVRVRNINNENIILDINYFLYDLVSTLTKDIAKDSIYKFLEDLNIKISGAKKLISVEQISKLDKKYLDLGNNNLVAIIKNFAYLDDGTLFEYTESHHRPDKFTFTTFARRSKI
ncbi:trehalose operon repressor [Clostridium baratii str. Sullivan]|uniref:Trehalose operon repressor n=1 Tax=Clostridium baratii str. Sullivan TaxID=1415775 RepID=A0A0A7FX10_9CLOT|nr:trehalose operon repressor [Clostridium baratii]AIY84174.1 trehalose operon repressor [Clostridium baratii str. Sullivan]